MHIVCSGRPRTATCEVAPVGRNAPWLIAVLRRPDTDDPTVLRTGPAVAGFVGTIVDEVLHAAPGAVLDVTFHGAPDSVIAQAVPRLLRLASRGVDVQVAAAARSDRPAAAVRWWATAQPSDAWSPPTAA
jgi:hypothetical protein